LNNGTNAVTGTYDLKFQLYDSVTGGTLLGGPTTNTAVGVTNGLFTVMVDFGAGVFTGSSNWLNIAVRTNGNGAFTALVPREQVTPTPYAIYAENANAAGLSGTVPTADLNLSGVSGSGLVSLNASQLTTGTVPDAVLAPDVALTDANQTFTGINIFSTGTGNGRLTVSGGSSIDTSLFTGLGFQYVAGSGEGAIMSSYNNGFGFLSFYTKQGNGYPVAQQMKIDQWGGVHIDLQNNNEGIINNSTTNGVGLTFGSGSGEGIASQRTAGTAANRYGLDFYTDFGRRMAISQGGLVGINVGTNLPTTQLEVNGGIRSDGNEFFLEPATSGVYVNDGLAWGNGGLPGINSGAASPWLAGYLGGALGAYAPNTVCLSWDASGNCWVSNNIAASTVSVRNNSTGASEYFYETGSSILASGEYLGVYGFGGVQPYIGDDGFGSDVQIGSLTHGITSVACYNAYDQAYMHLYCSSITIEGGADLAEPFKITSGKDEVPQGAVVVIDEQNPGHLKMSDQDYDPHVAGVVSGANGINPGIQMQQQGILDGGKNVALTGRVYVQADTSNGAIKPGDLLTTSSLPGHAMKVTDHARAAGAILGKAMTGLSEGKGLVLVLVTLQ